MMGCRCLSPYLGIYNHTHTYTAMGLHQVMCDEEGVAAEEQRATELENALLGLKGTYMPRTSPSFYFSNPLLSCLSSFAGCLFPCSALSLCLHMTTQPTREETLAKLQEEEEEAQPMEEDKNDGSGGGGCDGESELAALEQDLKREKAKLKALKREEKALRGVPVEGAGPVGGQGNRGKQGKKRRARQV